MANTTKEQALAIEMATRAFRDVLSAMFQKRINAVAAFDLGTDEAGMPYSVLVVVAPNHEIEQARVAMSGTRWITKAKG